MFRLLLPAAPLGDALSERPGPVETLVLEGNERILLVEDQVGVRTLGQRILTRKGYDVTVASNGLEAVELLEADGDPFDLILTDVVMPELSGPQLVERVRTWVRALEPEHVLDLFSGAGNLSVPVAIWYRTHTLEERSLVRLKSWSNHGKKRARHLK